MRARKAVGRASTLLTGIVADPRPARKQRYRINGFPVDDALYAAFQAARPAILLYLNGKGPRPKDFWSWHDAVQDRKALRRLHTKGIARDDPRYFDALIEATRAGDLLTKKEMKALAEHVRVMDDGFYPVLENRASELSGEVQGLVSKVSASEGLEKNRLAKLNQGNAKKRDIERDRQRHITKRLSDSKSIKKSKLTINGIVENLCRTSCERHPTVNDGYVFPHTIEKMENENVGERTIGPRRLNDYVSRALVGIELAARQRAHPREQQTPDLITNRLCKGRDRWLYNGVQSIKKVTLRAHVEKLLLLKSRDC